MIIRSRINNNLIKRYDGMTNLVDESELTSLNNRESQVSLYRD